MKNYPFKSEIQNYLRVPAMINETPELIEFHIHLPRRSVIYSNFKFIENKLILELTYTNDPIIKPDGTMLIELNEYKTYLEYECSVIVEDKLHSVTRRGVWLSIEVFDL